MKIFYIAVDNIPANCQECKCEFCQLPMKEYPQNYEIKKQYLTKRHKDCLLKIAND